MLRKQKTCERSFSGHLKTKFYFLTNILIVTHGVADDGDFLPSSVDGKMKGDKNR